MTTEPQVYDAVHARISPRSWGNHPLAGEVLRLLPTRDRRMVGAWCFADIYGPRPVGPQDAGEAMHVAPHPHTGLQTVSWLVSGEVTHRDSLGTTATVVPGRAAVMTAGAGIAHAEDVVGRLTRRAPCTGPSSGWPCRTRNGGVPPPSCCTSRPRPGRGRG